MIKTFPGGTGAEGFVKDSLFENFWSYDCTYGLDIDQYWESTTTPDTGAVALSGLTFSNWTGHVNNGVSRGPIVIRGSDIVPLQGITLEDFDMWTFTGNEIINQCKNVYGTGYCAAAGSGTAAFTTSVTTTVTPSGYVSPTSPAWGIEGYGTTDPIPIYTPAVFWPVVSAAASTTAAALSASPMSTATPVQATTATDSSVFETLLSSSSTANQRPYMASLSSVAVLADVITTLQTITSTKPTSRSSMPDLIVKSETIIAGVVSAGSSANECS